MKFSALLQIVGVQPVFTTGLLLAGTNNSQEVKRQLSRWAKAGKIYKLRKGLYSLAPPFLRVKPHPFLISNLLTLGSYVSNESALGYYNIIPEYSQTVTAVGICRPRTHQTPFGDFTFQHIKQPLLFGYHEVEVVSDQKALLATREKALIDLLYLREQSDSVYFLKELRLQNLEELNFDLLNTYADRLKSSKVLRCLRHVRNLVVEETEEYRRP